MEDINKWFNKFEKDLKFLFEDQTTKLIFLEEKLKYKIKQQNKPTHTFQDLSSGYLAIFDIYSDLLIRTAYLKTTPEDLSGVILIDEIDAHLHISLQRKILPFLTNSFPKIQFIVSTHSPYILSSVDNALIYNLSTNQQESDLSMYSFESITEGLLGVPAVSSALEKTIKDLALLTFQDGNNISEIKAILSKIEPHEKFLDTESEMYYQLARNKLISHKE